MNRLTVLVAVTAAVLACAAVPAVGSPHRSPATPTVSAPQTGTSRASGFSRSAVRAINSIVLSGLGSSGVPGMEVGVWIPGRGHFTRGYGTDDLATGSPFNLADHVRMASISKTFTATAALQLVDRGKLRLGDTLNLFCRGIPRCSSIPYVDQITVGQLLGMRAGVYSYSDDDRFNARYDARPTMPFSIRNVVKIIAAHSKQAVKPGTQTHYSNSDYYLLGAVVQDVTGKPLRKVISNMILKPLGLTETSYPTGVSIPPPFAHGYLPGSSGRGPRDVTRSNPAVAAGAGAMISTLGDLKKWARDLATGKLLSPALQARRLRFHVLGSANGITASYGLGISSINGFLGHTGEILGYNLAMYYLPARRATIIVITDMTTPSPAATSVFAALAKYFFPARFPAG